MISKKQLYKRLTQTTKSFAKLGDTTYHNGHQLTFIDNGGDVLAVCHLDYVLSTVPSIKKDTVFAPQLDDRLGAYIILDLLKKQGLKYDILLCDAEEIGQSTAANFVPPKQYNWAFEFDRQGGDVVLYDYEDSDDWVEAIWPYAHVGMGSFSDISELTPHNFCAVNWGCGYHNQHSYKCYADLNQTKLMVEAFIDFYQNNKDIHYPFQRKPKFTKLPYLPYYKTDENGDHNFGDDLTDDWDAPWDRKWGNPNKYYSHDTVDLDESDFWLGEIK